VAADVSDIRAIITPLGLHNKRAVAVQRLSHDFIHKEVSSPAGCCGTVATCPVSCESCHLGGRIWMDMDGYGWIWKDMDGYGWTRMDMDG
jgi:hypothetical protein